MKYWIFVLSILSASAHAIQVTYQWSDIVRHDSNNNDLNVDWTMTFDTETDRIISANASSALFNLETPDANSGQIYFDDYSLNFNGYTGYAFLTLVSASNPSDIWDVQYYDFWVINGNPSERPLDALPATRPIMNGWLSNNGSIWNINNGGVEMQPVPSTGEQPAEVPEPASIALLGLGLAGLWRRYS